MPRGRRCAHRGGGSLARPRGPGGKGGHLGLFCHTNTSYLPLSSPLLPPASTFLQTLPPFAHQHLTLFNVRIRRQQLHQAVTTSRTLSESSQLLLSCTLYVSWLQRFSFSLQASSKFRSNALQPTRNNLNKLLQHQASSRLSYQSSLWLTRLLT